jgi:hypothetical protein
LLCGIRRHEGAEFGVRSSEFGAAVVAVFRRARRVNLFRYARFIAVAAV